VILGVDGQARRVLEEAEGGLFVEPGDEERLSGAVIHLYRETALRKTLGDNGRDYIIKNLSRRRTAEQYINVLENAFF
jgi:glycosyltransferase involved in cell wall biosynthesis